MELNSQTDLAPSSSTLGRGFTNTGRRPNHPLSAPDTALSPAELDQHVERLRKSLVSGENNDKDVLIHRGKLVVQCLYRGDLTSWRRLGPRDAQFRALANRTNLPLPTTQLCQAVTLYELFDRLPELTCDPHVTLRHLDIIAQVPGADQEALLEALIEGRWTLRRLRNNVFGAEKRHATRGRPKHANVVKTLNTIARLRPNAFDGCSALGALPAQSARDYELALERHIAECQRLLSALSALS